MDGLRGSRSTTNDFYKDCDLRLWGICVLCDVSPYRHGPEQAGNGSWEEMNGWMGRLFLC